MTRTYIISLDLLRFVIALVVIVGVYLFSYQIQARVAGLFRVISKKLGFFTVTQEYEIQRYIYQHPRSLVGVFYRWVNNQLVAVGLKRNNVTPLGYVLFWGVSSLFLSVILGLVLRMGFAFTGAIWLLFWAAMLIMTRVVVSERMERREMEVMDAIDLIVPEIHNGTKNAIIQYQDNFAPGIREDFKAFVANIQDRGYSFNNAMYILADNLGDVFRDFADKAIYYEDIGDNELLDIFTDLVETNRLRRELRERNNRKFTELRVTFIVSSIMTFCYFIFIVVTDQFSRQFLLQTQAGNVILLIILVIVFGVLAFISTIKSRAI